MFHFHVAGFHDEMNVGDLLFGQPKFIALLSPKLDKESRTIGNWRSLATQFGIRKQKTEQFGLRGSGPTGALFSYMSTTKELRDLTMGELCQHFKAMERRDLVNILEKHNCEGLCFCICSDLNYLKLHSLLSLVSKSEQKEKKEEKNFYFAIAY